MKIEKFDYIHDVQKIYRKLLDSMSKPGKINNIKEETDKIELHCEGLSKGVMGLAHTLLNLESTFYIKDKLKQNYIKLHTLSKIKNISKSEFIFVEKENYTNIELINIMDECEIGDLENPHLGATLIIEVSNIENDGNLLFRGPGIKTKNSFRVKDLDVEFFQKREEINMDFPLGIDIILVDKLGNIGCIPRTTKVEVND